MQKLNMAWLLSIERLIELTERDPKRVVRPVSPQIVIRHVLLAKKGEKQKSVRRSSRRKRRQG